MNPLRKQYFYLVLAGCLTLAYSCKSTKEVPAISKVKVTSSGLQYQITQEANGVQAEAGDMVKVHYTGKLTTGEVFDNSLDRGEPISFKLGAGMVIKGWDEGIALMKEGEKATFTIPPHLGYGEKEMGKIPANSTLIFDVDLVKVIKAVKPYDAKGKEKMKTNSGLEYTIVEQGSGAKAAPGKIVRVHYTGYFEDGTTFDSSVERGEPIEFPLGKGMVIPGWEEGISLLRVGDKAKLYIPYHLAYGESGRGPIPAKSNLIFDVELVEVKEIPQVIPFNVEGKDTIATESGLKYIVVGQGNGKKAEAGKVVTVHYTGYLTNGEMFDSSVQRGQTFKFILGQGQVISGWDEGVALMSEGSRYRLVIPSNLGYGNREIGPIPAGSTLIFDVELIKVD